MTRLTTCASAEKASGRAATEIARRLQGVREERGTAHLALSGGSTPARTYELLCSALESWHDVDVWFADERCVEPNDDESNYKLARQTLLDGAVGLDPARVHRMQGELGPEQGAQLYAAELRENAPVENELPVLDVIVLGIGPDGHIASLFPGAPTLDVKAPELCVGVHDSPKPPPERITLTLPVLHAARRCLLLATGAAKADAVDAMLAEPNHHVPASLLRRERLTVIVDDAASPEEKGQ